jgi:hypothetical protein
MFPWIETFGTLPTGIETWNTKYDGPHAPRPRTFALLNRLQQRKPGMKAFYGQDLHWKRQYRGLSNLVDCDSLTRTAVLAAFRRGNYSGISQKLELPSDGVLPESQLKTFGKINERYMLKQDAFKRVKKLSGAFGKNLPAPIKSRIRKILS